MNTKTVARYVAVREAGGDPFTPARRLQAVDPFLPKLEELVDRSKGKIRADVAHRKLVAMEYRGSARSIRRAVAELKAAWRAGPGMWLQWDWGEGPASPAAARSCSAPGWRGRDSGW